jgi:hypothetical protein
MMPPKRPFRPRIEVGVAIAGAWSAVKAKAKVRRRIGGCILDQMEIGRGVLGMEIGRGVLGMEIGLGESLGWRSGGESLGWRSG